MRDNYVEKDEILSVASAGDGQVFGILELLQIKNCQLANNWISKLEEGLIYLFFRKLCKITYNFCRERERKRLSQILYLITTT